MGEKNSTQQITGAEARLQQAARLRGEAMMKNELKHNWDYFHLNTTTATAHTHQAHKEHDAFGGAMVL